MLAAGKKGEPTGHWSHTLDAVENTAPLRFNSHTRSQGEEVQREKEVSMDGRDTSRDRETNTAKPAFAKDKDEESMGCGEGCVGTMVARRE